MAEKVTMMVIKVDLQCDRCYKKIRKVLCGFPEIRDQVYDEKQNAVKITVVSCCPDRIKKKICSKGGKSVEKIEIVSGDKKKEPEKKKEGGSEKAKDSAAGGEKKKDEPEKKGGKEGEPKKKEGGKEGEPKKKEGEKGSAKEPEKKKEDGDKPKDKEPEMKPKPKQPMPVPVAGYPSIFPPVYPVQAYYDPYQQHQVAVGGPRPCHCQQCHGNMPGYYGARDANRGGYNGCQYDYFSEENPSGCTVM